MSHFHNGAFTYSIFCLWFILCLQIANVHSAIHSRKSSSSSSALQSSSKMNAIDDSDVADTEDSINTNVANELSTTKKHHHQQPYEHSTKANLPTVPIKRDFSEKMTWQCANNATCLHTLATDIIQAYKSGDLISLGFMDLTKLAPMSEKEKDKLFVKESGRGISTFVDFISGNAIRIPVGPMVFSVQRAEDDGNYIEVALLKKASSSQGRGGGLGGGGMGGGGMGGGGLGEGLLSGLGSGMGGGGGEGGGGHRGRYRKQKQDKKQFQMYIPMYLAASTFGWTMVAAKAVGLLTLKALAVSKLAFIVAAIVIIKKMMDNASEKMMYQFPEHSPYVMPYSMDYGMHPEMASSGDMYPAALQLAAAQQQSGGHSGLESLAAESSFHHNIADMQNNTQVLAALNAVHLGPKVKRDDSWLTKTAAAVGVRRPLVYNYMQPHHPYYRA